MNKANICLFFYIYIRVVHNGFYDGRVGYISVGNSKLALPRSKPEVAMIQYHMFSV